MLHVIVQKILGKENLTDQVIKCSMCMEDA